MPALSVLALVTDAFGGRGGIAQYNRDLLSAMALTAATKIVVVPRAAPDPAILPAGVVQVAPRLGRIAYTLAALRAAIGRRFDVVLCGHLYMAPLAWLIARWLGARLVVQMHGIDAWDRPARHRRVAVEKADLILCVSRYTRACVLGWATLAPERVLVLPNTVGEDFTPGDGSALRTKWGLEGKRVLLGAGRMSASEHYKGQDRVIAAIPKIVAAGQDVVYVVLGEGDDRPRLERLVRDVGVVDRVQFRGAVSRETLIEAYRMADLFAMPSTGEGFGIAFLEAMASGTPAAGLNVAGARDALADGELGTFVSESDLSGALVSLLSSPKPDSVTLCAKVRARFGRQIFTAQVGAIFTEILSTI